MLKQGNDFNELSSTNPVQQELSIHNRDGRALRETVYFGTLPSTKLRALQTLARTYRHRRRQNRKVVPIAIGDEDSCRGG